MFRNILQEIDISDLVVNGNLKESFIDALHENIDNIETAYDKEVKEVGISDILEEENECSVCGNPLTQTETSIGNTCDCCFDDNN